MTIIGDASKARLIALFIDNIIAFAVTMAVVAFIPESLPQMKFVFCFFTPLAYFIVLEAVWSRTFGKFFQGLIVRQLDGSPCTWKAASIRGAMRLVEVNPLLLGGLPAGLAIIASVRKQRLGDLLAGTIVVSHNLVWESNTADNADEEQPADHSSSDANLSIT